MKRNILFQIIAFSIIFLTACSGGGDGGAPSTGTVSVALTDATTTDFKAIYITIEEVAVHKDGGGWKVISTPSKTYNLLELVNGVREELGLATLATGHYTQMRLVLKNKPDDSLNVLSQKHLYGNYFIDTNDNIVELKVPSGYQTGIKIVKGFDINANETTELVLDFDATRSIVMAGSSGTWLLKPTIKVMETKDYCIISGKAGEEGVLISAQIYNGSSSTEEGKVQIEAATVSDENGNYKLFVAPGTYTLVGYKDGRTTFVKSTKVVTAAGSTYTENFTLSSSLMGTLAGGPITILDASLGLEQYSTFSIRQDKTVSGNAEQIEVKSFNVANGGLFIVADNTAVPLPVGDYEAIISTFDYLTGSGRKEIKEAPITIGAAATTDIGPITY